MKEKAIKVQVLSIESFYKKKKCMVHCHLMVKKVTILHLTRKGTLKSSFGIHFGLYRRNPLGTVQKIFDRGCFSVSYLSGYRRNDDIVGRIGRKGMYQVFVSIKVSQYSTGDDNLYTYSAVILQIIVFIQSFREGTRKCLW